MALTGALTADFSDFVNEANKASAATPHKFSGLAWLDAELDTDVEGAPGLSSTFMAAGPWTMPTIP